MSITTKTRRHTWRTYRKLLSARVEKTPTDFIRYRYIYLHRVFRCYNTVYKRDNLKRTNESVAPTRFTLF